MTNVARSARRHAALALGAVLLVTGAWPGSAAAAAPGHATGTLPLSATTALGGLGATPAGTTPPGTTAAPPDLVQDPTDLLRAALDAQVTRAVAGSRWQVVRITSQLKQSALEETASRQAGSGFWQVFIKDANGALSTLEGNLDFEVTTEPGVGAGTGRYDVSSESHVTGSLGVPNAAEGLGLVIDSDQTSSQAGVSIKQQVVDDLKVGQSSGVVDHVRVSRSVDVEMLAWDLQRITESVTTDRQSLPVDAATGLAAQPGTPAGSEPEHHQVNRTTLLRQFGHGESEVWQRVDLDPTAPDTSAQIRLHGFQRLRHGQAQMEVKAFTFAVAGKTIDIDGPGTVTVAGDGSYNVGLDFTLNRAPLGDVQGGSAAARTATRPADLGRQVLDSVRPPAPPVPETNDSACTVIAGALAAALLGIALSYAIAPLIVAASGEAITLAAVSGEVFGSAGLTNIILGLIVGISANALKEKYPGNSGLIDAIAAILGIAIGIGTGIPGKSGGVGAVMGGNSGILGVLLGLAADAIGGAICNADPYFVYPDVRAGLPPDDPAPASLLRTTGGLIVPDDALNVPGLAPPAAASAAAPADFSDAATAFVAGSVPQGATQIGPWQFDPSRTYGTAESHTEPAADGPHRHVFIHAQTPLALASGDSLVQYVWIDPDHPVKELLLQFYTGDGDGEHRAYWGDTLLQTGGTAGSASLYPMGALPAAGGWVRLKVPASAVGLEGASVSGVLYGSWDGQVWWGPTTSSSRVQDSAPDAVAVDPPTAPAPTTNGSEISFRLADAANVTLTITDATGATVRTLLDGVTLTAGYHVATWDATDDAGKAVADSPYVAALQVAGPTTTAFRQPVTVTPFVASIAAPGEMSLVRGTAVPILGAAYGAHFAKYTLEAGAGRTPTTWTPIADGTGPVVPAVIDTLKPNIKLGAWDAGLDELRPFTEKGLSGLQTLRLTVTGDDGRTATDQQVVVVGEIAHSAEGGTISSPDGRATLTIPPLATSESLSLLAILPLSETQPGFDVTKTLPASLTAAGEAWEILPPDESFRSAAELVLPGTDPTGGQPNTQEILGILIGDGTPGGWRTLPYWPSSDAPPFNAAITELGGRRAIVVPVTGTDYPPGVDQPAPPPSVADSNAAPPLSSSIGVSLDFQSTPAGVAAVDGGGTQLAIVSGAAAGLPQGDSALKVTRGARGARLLSVANPTSGAYDATALPILAFDYRLDPGYVPDILVRANDHVFDIHTGNGAIGLTKYYLPVSAPSLVDDGAWHHEQLDLLSLLRDADPGETSYTIDEILMGQVSWLAYGQVVPADNGAIGSSYLIDNVAEAIPVSGPDLEVNVGRVGGAYPAAVSVVVDRKRSTQPPAQASSVQTGTEGALLLRLPNNTADGTWYVHVRGRFGSRWSATGTYPVIVDRTPPATSDLFPADGSSGGPTSLSLGITDGTGVDASKITATVNAGSGSYGHGVRYEPGRDEIQVEPNLFQMPGAVIPTGAAVSVTVGGLTDYAGNRAPDVTWHFTADAPRVPGDDFHQLTAKSGWSPAISPDGSRVAFVSDRDGTPRIYVMNADDFTESAGSATPLIAGGSDREWDPAWSLDGSQIAFGSSAGGSDQLWIAGADGSGARAITAGPGNVATPSFAADGSGVAFVRDGNAWLTDPSSGAIRALTTSPDHPYAGLAWQPGGSSVALHFSLYEDRIELLDTVTGDITQVTSTGSESEPAWLDSGHILYTAPQATGAQDAIWQVDPDGTNGTFLGGSGITGVADSEADAAPNGGAVVITSTRGGGRDVWIRRELTIGSFEASPPQGAPPGEAAELNWTLPEAATVSVDVMDLSGTPVRTLLSSASEQRGPNSVTWDGRDGSGADLKPGLYTARLSAVVAGVPDPLERITTLQVLDARDIGNLNVTVQAFPGTSAATLLAKVRVYPAGSRLDPLAEAYASDTASFKLPAGRYDVVALVQNEPQAVATNVAVTGGQTAQKTIDLGFGQLDVTALSAPGQPAGPETFVRIRRSDDPTLATVGLAFGGQTSFLLPAATYDVSADFQGTSATAYSVQVKRGTLVNQSIDLGSGVVTVAVDAWAGTPAYANQLIVRAFRPDDHQNPVGQALYVNPGEIRLPAGTYDLYVRYDGSAETHASASIERWITGVTVTTGGTTPVNVNLDLGELDLSVLQAAGVPATPSSVVVRIVPDQTPDIQHEVGAMLYIQQGVLQLPAGRYRAIVRYDRSDTEASPLPQVFEVVTGQRATQSIDLALGHLSVALVDTSGTPITPAGLLAFYAQATDTSFAITVFNTSPTDFSLRAGVAYAITAQIDPPSGDPIYAALGTVTLGEGQQQTLTVTLDQFQPKP